MAKRKATRLVVLALALLPLGFVALRAVPRWLAIQELLGSPERAAVLAVEPEPMIRVTPSVKPSSPLIHIGYAEFSLPAVLDSTMTSLGRGDVVMLESDRLSLGLFAPADVDTTDLLRLVGEIEETSGAGSAEWIEKRFIGTGSVTDRASLVDMQLLAAEARPLPFSTLFMMSRSGFVAYLTKLVLKALLSPQAKRILPFEGAHTVGLMYVREGGTRGVIELTAHDRSISQGITFQIHGPDESLPSPPLAAFLATYRFIIDSCPSQDQVAEMIAASGIMPRVPPEEDPAAGEELEKGASLDQR